MMPDPDIHAVLGPARLAYYTPTGELSPLAERKAVFLLGASGLIGTVMIFFLPRLAELIDSPSRVLSVTVILILPVLLVLLLAAAWFSYRAVTTGIPDMPDSPAYFRHVAGRSLEEYERQVRRLTHPEALRAILHYNYSIAQQAVRKFEHVKRSLRCMRVAILLWILLLLIIAIAD